MFRAGKHRSEETYIVIDFPVTIFGEGSDTTEFHGGLHITGKKSNGVVVVNNLTICNEKGSGLWGRGGMDVIMRRCTIENCKYYGVYAYKTHITCEDIQVIGCGESGVYAGTGGLITMSGSNTSITQNNKGGDSDYYGLEACFSSSTIQLISPLTKESISTNNGLGHNWGGSGTIKQINQ